MPTRSLGKVRSARQVSAEATGWRGVAGRAVLAIGWALGVCSLGGDGALAAPDGVGCRILAERAPGAGIVLEGLISADAELRGTYRLHAEARGAGNASRVSQSAGFAAGPGAPARIGRVTLGGGGDIDVSLEIAWADGSTACKLRIPAG